jgi:two-component system sensor histidine kinase/response regulator
MNVLVVDDDRLNQLVAAGLLKKLGVEVEIVSTGAKALEACAASRYDAVLMDIMMPNMNGYEATARIRELDAAEREQHTVVIGLSARAMEGDRERALDAGLDDYLTKPLREDDLARALRSWCPTLS